MADGPGLDPALRAELAESVGDEHVLVDADVIAGHGVDWTGRYVGRASAVVRPGTVGEVAAVVRTCRRWGTALVPQGGNTGLVGGSVPRAGELVLSTRRLERLEPVDTVAGQVTAGAGVTLEALARHVAAAGWRYPVDFAARASATVGGTVATNAGGVHVVRWGPTRAQVLGVEAVLGDGSVVRHLDGLVKDNTGYDLAGLLCGSEGTLGVVTAARLRLVPPATHVVTAVVAFADPGPAVAGVVAWRRQLPGLVAAELVTADGVALVVEALGVEAPFAEAHPVLVLIEVEGTADPTAEVAEAVAATDGVRAVAVADGPTRRAALWRVREEHSAAINTLGPPHKLDVTVPIASLAAFLGEVPDRVAAVRPDARVWLFGHVGDGNVHVNVTGPDPDDDTVDDAVLGLVADHHGSVSAEHGVGTAKRRWLHLSRSPAEIDAFRAIKDALDPDGILNPGVLLPP